MQTFTDPTNEFGSRMQQGAARPGVSLVIVPLLPILFFIALIFAIWKWGRHAALIAAVAVLLNCSSWAATNLNINNIQVTNVVYGTNRILVTKVGPQGTNSTSIPIDNLFSNRVYAGTGTFSGPVTFNSTVNLPAGGSVTTPQINVASNLDVNANIYYNTKLLLPSSQLTNYLVYTTNAEYVVNATNDVKLLPTSFSDAPSNRTVFVGITITNYSGADRALHFSPTHFLGTRVTIITNGFWCRVVFSSYVDAIGTIYSVGSAKHE